MDDDKTVLKVGLAVSLAVAACIGAWVFYFSPAATLDRAESSADVSLLLELAGKGNWDLGLRVHAMRTAFMLMKENEIQSPKLDAQISDVGTKFARGARKHRYKSGGRGWDYASSDLSRRLKDLNRSYVETVGLRLVNKVEHHLVPRRRQRTPPETAPKQRVDLVLRLWRDPETNTLSLRGPSHLQNYVGTRDPLWSGSLTRSVIDNQLAKARRLGIEVLSLTKTGTYRPEPSTSYLSPRDCGSQRPFAGKAFQQVIDLYVVDLKEDRLLSSYVGLIGGPPPGSTKKCYGVGERPNGPWSSFFSASD